MSLLIVKSSGCKKAILEYDPWNIKKFDNSNETGRSNIMVLLGTLRLLLGTLRYLQELWVVWGTLGSLSYLQVFLCTFWVFPGSFCTLGYF